MRPGIRIAVALLLSCTMEALIFAYSVKFSQINIFLVLPGVTFLVLQLLSHVASFPDIALVTHGLRTLFLVPVIITASFWYSTQGTILANSRMVCNACNADLKQYIQGQCETACLRSSHLEENYQSFTPFAFSISFLVNFTSLLWIRSCISSSDYK
jgi:hypothetical protein